MSKKDRSQEELVSSSINSIYQHLIEKKEQQRAEFEARKEEEEKKKEEEAQKTKEEKKKAKEEKRKAWMSVLEEMTGQDMEYLGKKVKDRGNNYKHWFDIETEKTEVPKKRKKHNYSKEFEQELKMLRAAVSEQNKFTNDLHKRFQNALGPATKDGQVPSKTMVELAGAINAGRSNALGMIREIAAIKKAIADLRMKQQKIDYDTMKSQQGTTDTTDLGLLGSSILSSMDTYYPASIQTSPVPEGPYSNTGVDQQSQLNIDKFDPAQWEGPKLENDFVQYENIPHEVMVEMNDLTGFRRFMAVESSSGNEITGCNMPTTDPMTLKYDPRNDAVIGTFGESYKVKHV